MIKMVWLFFLFSLLLCSAVKCQESMELLPLQDSTLALKPLSQNGLSMAVQMETLHLRNVSNSVLMAESWLRTHVLRHYPSTNISTIIVGHSGLCSKDQQHNLRFVLPSIKNIHHSLTRWGLQKDIKVSASLSSDCLDSLSETYSSGVAEAYIKPLLTFLQEIGSPCVVNPLSDETASSSLKSHLKSMENLGVFPTGTMDVILTSARKEKPSRRKLLFIDISNSVLPFPPRPTPATAPSRSSSPAYAVGSPLPPLVGTVTPPPDSLPVSPVQPPSAAIHRSPPFLPYMAPAPYGPHLPPCEPSQGGAPAAGGHHAAWCVAKPSVPAETLQEALDYACGEGNADCEAIQEEGSCYYPDNLVAHASYAFNSYWQKTKKNGGTCGFGGTAMLINSDPSYAHCRFILT